MQIKTCFQYQPSDTIQTRTEWTENKNKKIKKTALLCCWFNYSIRLEDQIENTARKRIFISLHKQIDLWECLQAFSMEPHRFLSFKRRHKCEGGCTFVEYSVGDHLRRSISGLHTSGTLFIYVTYVHSHRRMKQNEQWTTVHLDACNI